MKTKEGAGKRHSNKADARNLEFEKDALHILPLSILPLQTPALREARMLKNVRFESMIEIFNDSEGGSGQVEPSRLARMFDWPEGARHPDGILIAKLSLLQSFDIYSLRIQLRSFQIEVENIDHLRLSPKRRRELDTYLDAFTKPLYDMLQTEDGSDIIDLDDLANSLNRANRAAVLSNLTDMSKRLDIVLPKLPGFLTDFGDVFLSLAYFKDHFDRLLPKIAALLARLLALRDDPACKTNPALLSSVDKVCSDTAAIMSRIAKRMNEFDEHTANMWDNIGEEAFRKVKVLIESNHGAIGGMLCGLHIILQGYQERFPNGPRQPQELADYVSAYIEPATDRIALIERSARLADSR